MTMYRRAVGGKITDSSLNDGMVMCHACQRIIANRSNLKNGEYCPFCHNNINVILGDNALGDDNLYDDDDNDVVALPC